MKEKYIVVWAAYNRNESKDALQCGMFRDEYPTMEMAYKAARGQIIQEAIENIADCPDWDGRPQKDADQLAAGWIWHDSPGQICEEHDGIESVYNIIAR